MGFVTSNLIQIDEHYFYSAMALSIGVSLILSLFGVIIVNQIVFDLKHKKSGSLAKAVKVNLKYIFIETTRAFVPIILKSFLLLIPGLLEAVRLYWVPYVVQFDRDYKEGKVDALEKSRQLTKGHLAAIILIVILTAVISLAPHFWLRSIGFLRSPYLFSLAFFTAISLELYSDIVLFGLYDRLVATKASSN